MPYGTPAPAPALGSPEIRQDIPNAHKTPSMEAFVYGGVGKSGLEDRSRPQIQAPNDTFVKIVKTTICGTDLHIPKGDVATYAPCRILGHEGVGIIDSVGAGVTTFHPGNRVLIACITPYGKCGYCRREMYSHCTDGGWILGNGIDGAHAEFVSIPYAETSLCPIPVAADEEAIVMSNDILPTSFKCGVLDGKVVRGGSVAIAGSGLIGSAALLTAPLYSPVEIIVIDLDDDRLAKAKAFGATRTIDSGDGRVVENVIALTGGRRVNTAVEAVGAPPTFELCQKLVASGGVIANIGAHGQKVELHL